MFSPSLLSRGKGFVSPERLLDARASFFIPRAASTCEGDSQGERRQGSLAEERRSPQTGSHCFHSPRRRWGSLIGFPVSLPDCTVKSAGREKGEEGLSAASHLHPYGIGGSFADAELPAGRPLLGGSGALVPGAPKGIFS